MTQQNLKKTVRSMTIAGLALVMLASTAVSAGACEFIDNLMPWNWCKQDEVVATCAPLYTPTCTTACYPTSCSPCATPSTYMTARYIPQTSFRTAYRAMPITTFRPVTGYRRVAQLVPYTTYRLSWQSNRCYTSCYTPCTTSCLSPCSPCASCTTCSPCSTCSPCATGSCGTCSSCDSCGDCGSCGDSGSCETGDCYGGSFGSSSSGCSACGVSNTTIKSSPSTYSNGSQQPTLPNGSTYESQRPVEPKVIKPTPEPDPTTSRNYKSEPFKVPQLVPAGRTASNPVRLISYQQSDSSPRTLAPLTTMSNVVDDTNAWQAR